MLAFLLGLVPGLLSTATSYFTNVRNAQVAIYQAQTGHAADVAVAAIQANAQVSTKWWWFAAAGACMGWAVALYIAKCIVWDKVIGSFVGCSGHPALGTCTTFSTDDVGSNLAWVISTVVLGYFGAGVATRILGK